MERSLGSVSTNASILAGLSPRAAEEALWRARGPSTGWSLVVAALLAACGSPAPSGASASAFASSAPPWPALPRTPSEARALIEARTTRSPAGGVADEAFGADALARAVASPPSPIIAGASAIVSSLQAKLDAAGERDAHLLVGTLHDAGGQIDFFRRLVGPGGLRGLTAVAVEQWRSDGHWAGLSMDVQRGDDADLTAYVRRGDSLALARLAEGHARTDYASWKFAYEPAVLELAVSARAGGVALCGCDMPDPVKKAVESLSDDDRLRLRELHCALSLPEGPKPRRVALAWGQSHVRPGGLPRFLPADAVVLSVSLFGHRGGEGTVEHDLGKRLGVVDPVLVPLDAAGAEAALLLPAGDLGVEVTRVREAAAGPDAELRVSVLEGSATLYVGPRTLRIEAYPKVMPLQPGDTAYVLEAGDTRYVGALERRAGRTFEIVLDPRRRALSLTQRDLP